MLPILGTGTLTIFTNIALIGIFSTIAFPIGIALYLLLLPIAVVMMLYLRKANIQVSMSGTSPMPAADTVDMPFTFKFVLIVEKVMKRLTEIAALPCLILFILSFFPGYPPNILAYMVVLFLLILRFGLIPAFSIVQKAE